MRCASQGPGPSQEAIGTPTTVATVKPVMTWATALARFRGPIRKDATIAATPKKAPCGRPATKRAAISSPYDGANMLTRLLTVNTAISPNSTVFLRHPCGQRGNQRRPDDHAERVRRNDVPGGWFGDGEAGRDVRKQSHRDELGGSDAEPANGKREHRQPPHRGGGGNDGNRGQRPFKRDGHKGWTFLWLDVGHGNETLAIPQTDLGILTVKVAQVTIDDDPDRPYWNR